MQHGVRRRVHCLYRRKEGPGTDGTCGTIAAGLDPDSECASMPPCGTTGVCNGAGACQLAAQGTTCAALLSCFGDMQTSATMCDGNGSCSLGPTTVSCSPYVCGPSSCKHSCVTDADCAAGFTCTAGVCH
jgi:hypothetical protein